MAKRNRMEDFWKYVNVIDENSCWEWQGEKVVKGYGRFYIGQKRFVASRYCYDNFVEKIKDTTLQVCHKCDNPSCVNPKHLFLGTPQDNTKDMVSKGRNFIVPKELRKFPAGENNGNSTLTEKDVLEIRNKYVPFQYGAQTLAKEYGINKKTVQSILRRNTWKHI